MKVSLHFGSLLLALLLWSPASALADTRMQVAVPSSPVMNAPSGSAQSAGKVTAGEILFVSRVEGDWAAISPPERFTLWLNKDFIEGNRVVAKVIQVRSGPGIQHPVVGTLERGAPVMPRGEEGDWCKIAPPSSCTLWVNTKDLDAVPTRTTPIREVEAVAEPKKPEPKPQPVASKPAPKSKPKKTASTVQTAELPPPLSPTPTQVAPSKPRAKTTQTTRRSTPVSAATKPPTASTAKTPGPVAQAPMTTPKKPAPRKKTVSASKPSPAVTAVSSPALRPATALPTQPSKPVKKRVRRKRKTSTKTTAVPAPAKTVAKPKKQKLDVQVDPVLVADLDLADLPNQGKSVQVEGEVRNAPFLSASPSRYRLLDYDGRVLEMVCHLHGESSVLRQFVGKGVSIRGREYWVENSDMPVVVVGEIIPLAPSSSADEPILF